MGVNICEVGPRRQGEASRGSLLPRPGTDLPPAISTSHISRELALGTSDVLQFIGEELGQGGGLSEYSYLRSSNFISSSVIGFATAIPRSSSISEALSKSFSPTHTAEYWVPNFPSEAFETFKSLNPSLV